MVTFDPTAVLRLEVEIAPPAGKSKNLVKNTDGARGGFFWVTPTQGGISRSTVNPGNLRYAPSVVGASGFKTERMPVTPGQYASARFMIQTISAGTITARIVFENAAGGVVSTTLGSPAYGASPGTERLYGPHLVPAGAVTARLAFIPSGLVPGQSVEWTGAGFVCRASATPITVWATDVVQAGPTWLNVLGKAIEIDVDKAALDLGTLSALIRDATLDPMVATTIRPGRECRLTALHAVTGVWESLFEGEVTDFDVAYEAEVLARNAGDPKHCKITIAAADPTRTLAGVRRPEGVANIYHLREAVLEDAGVPWDTNGNTNHTGEVPVVVSYNENATALDQVALTRDSLDLHAWVDRRGVLCVWERAKLQPFTGGGVEVDASQWVAIAPAAIARVTTPTASGVGALQVTANTTAATVRTTPVVRVIPGHSYTVTVKVRSAAAVGRQARLEIGWRDSSGAAASTPTVVGSYSVVTVGAWTTLTVTGVPPIDGVNLRADVRFDGTVAGEVFYVDDLAGLNAEVVLDESVWTKIEIGGGSKQAINEVSIDFIRLIPAPTGSGEDPKTEVVPYGPYRDETSIAEYGVRPARFTIHGTNEGANVATVSGAILAANAFPKVSAREVTFPIKSAADLVMTRGFADLYQPALVGFATKGYSEYLRIAGVNHKIKADPKYGARWIVTLSFEASNTVASPRALPAPPTNSQNVPVGPWVNLQLLNGWVNYDSGSTLGGAGRPAQVCKIGGIVYFRGVIRSGSIAGVPAFVIPSGYRPAVAGTYEYSVPCVVAGAVQSLNLDAATGNVLPPASAAAQAYTYLSTLGGYPAA